MPVRLFVFSTMFFLIPLCANGQSRVDTLLGSFSDGWRASWNEQILADAGNDFRVSVDGQSLRVRSENSASALWRTVDYSERERVTLKWRWKIDRTIPDNARERDKSGDDYPARLFIVFEGTPFEFRSRAVCYVWASSETVGAAFINPHVDNVATVVLQSGDELVGQWLAEERDVVADFEALYGRLPSTVTGVALMVDTDNTHTSAIAWFDDVEAYVASAGTPQCPRCTTHNLVPL